MKIIFFVLLILNTGLLNAQTDSVVTIAPEYLVIPKKLTMKIDRRLSTDRPTISYCPATVGSKNLVLETGFRYAYDKNANLENRTINYNTSTLRFPVSEDFELRISGNYQRFSQTYIPTGETGDTQGMTPMSLGGKIRLNVPQRHFGLLSIVFNIGLNKASSTIYRTPFPHHELTLAGSIYKGKNTFGYNLGSFWTGYSPDINGKYSIYMVRQLLPRLSAVGELYGTWPQGTTADIAVDAGMLYNLTLNLQLDISAGYGISERSDDWFVSAGICGRLNW